jgi:putative membrane protein
MEEEQRLLSFHAFFRGIILFGFTMLIFSFILSGKIAYYIAPKMMPFIYFAVIVFFALSIIQIIRSMPKSVEKNCNCDSDHDISASKLKNVVIYSIFIVPLLLGFVLPEQVLDSSIVAKRGITLGGQANTLSTSAMLNNGDTAISNRNQAVTQGQNQSTTEQNSSSLTSEDYFARLDAFDLNNDSEEHVPVDVWSWEGFDDFYSNMAQEALSQDRIVITDENYLDMLTVIDIYLDDFIGKEVEIMGFVYRELGFKLNEMVIARFAMTCCAADAAPYGFLVRGEETRIFSNDTWVYAHGSIDKTEYNGWVIPMLHIEHIDEVPAPATPYVFYNFN